MSQRSIMPFPCNEAGLVGKFIGSAYDTVKRVYDNLEEIQRLDNVLDEIDTVAERVSRETMEALVPEFKQQLQVQVDEATQIVEQGATRIEEIIAGADDFAGQAAASAEAAAESATRAEQAYDSVMESVNVLRNDLTNSTDPLKGLGMFKVNTDLLYPVDSAGAQLKKAILDTPEGYGAVGDGVTDDTQAIQRYLNSRLKIDLGDKSKHYLVSGTLQLRNGHTISGQWPKLTQTVSQTPMWNAVGLSDVKVTSLEMLGAAGAYVNNPTSRDIAILGDSASNLQVIGNIFRNFQYSPLMVGQAGNDILFAFNVVDGPGASVLNDPNFRNTTGFTILGNQVRVHGNRIRWTASGGIIGQLSKDVAVTNNIIKNIITEHGFYCDSGIDGLLLANNIIDDTVASGLKVQNYDAMGTVSRNVNIIGNVITNVSKGQCILVNNTGGYTLRVKGLNVVGNICSKNGAGSTIDIRYADDALITGNLTSDAAECGLFTQNLKNANVFGNMTARTQYHGIWSILNEGCSFGKNAILNPNLGSGNAGSGIINAGGGNNDYFENRIRGEGKMVYGIFFEDGDQTTCGIWGNHISGQSSAPIRLKSTVERLRYFGENCFTGEVQSLSTNMQRGNLQNNKFISTAIPTSGTYSQGDRIENPYPQVGGYMGWVCVVAGSPGTWRGYGLVASTA